MNFDKIINRKQTNSLKWDGADRLLHQNSEKMWESSVVGSLPEHFLPMWAADMDFEVAAPILDKLKSRVEHGILGYGIRPQSYNDVLVEWLMKRHQWNCKAEWMVYCPGVLPAINLAIDALTDKGDSIVIQPPVYYRFSQAINQNERVVIKSPLILKDDEYSIDFEQLEQLFKQGAKSLLFCNPHNPTGTCWSRETLTELAQLCVKYRIIVISDEIHSDLILRGNKHIPLASISEEIANLTVMCVAPSKTFNLAGLRTAALIIPNELIRVTMTKKIAQYGLDVSNVFGLIAFETAYQLGENWLDSLLNYLEKNIETIHQFINTRQDLEIITPQATHMVWLDFRTFGLSSEEVKQKLIREAHVGLSDGRTYFGKEGEGFQRMNIACANAQLVEALERIDKVF